jgi:leucyl aminopeptidase (aminopeptidase T)
MLSVIRNIFMVNLGLKKTERCLLFTDSPSPDEVIGPEEAERRSRLKCIAFLASETGKSLSRQLLFHEYPATGSHGAEPPAELWRLAFGKRAVAALERRNLLGSLLKKEADVQGLAEAERIISRWRDDAVDAVVALSNYSTSHTRFRDFLTRICAARYASMPLFEVSMLEGPMNVNWRRLAALSKQIGMKVRKADAVEIRTGNGSRLSFSIRGRKVLEDTGVLTKPGSFGNLPAGEVFLAPLEGTAEGRLVLEWAPTRQLKSPVTVTVRKGFIADISGEEEFAASFRKKVAERRENANVAELGIGTNDRAKRPDNILESEKIMGTIHIAFGDNSSFGGSVQTPLHQDFVFFRPTVVLVQKDGSRVHLMKNGKFV